MTALASARRQVVQHTGRRAMARLFCRILMVLVALAAGWLPAGAQGRRALVIGNDAYANVIALQKAANDARTMAATLRGLGFKVDEALNASRRDMNLAIENFVSKVEPGDVAMFFYAGHGVEISGENFLLPTDIPNARPGQEGFVKAESIGLNTILTRLKQRRARINIVILDACRNNPFARGGGRGVGTTRGLARVNSPQGTFIMYSADAGQEALDRLSAGDANPNSVFTRTLITVMKQPGIDLVQTAREVRRRVRKLALSVSHSQTPAYYDAVLGDFYLGGAKPASVPQVVTQTPPQGDVKGDFLIARSVGTKDAWAAFIDRHGARRENYYVRLALAAQAKFEAAARPLVKKPHKSAGSCKQTGAILNYANHILDNRAALPRFYKRRFGTRAAYMKIRYGKLGYDAGLRVLKPLLGKKIRGIRELTAAFVVQGRGVDAATRLLGDDPVLAFTRFGRFGMRAVIEIDRGKTFLRWVARARASSRYNKTFRSGPGLMLGLAYLIADQSDEFKTDFAGNALAAGERVLAAAVLATMTSLDKYYAFLEVYQDDKLVSGMFRRGTLTGYGLTQVHNTGPGLDREKLPDADKTRYRQLYSVMRAAFYSGESDMLGTVLNQSGKIGEVNGVAIAYMKQVDGGLIDPVRDPDKAWLFVYRQLNKVFGPKEFETYGAFGFPYTRHYMGQSVSEGMGWVIAADALAGYVNGTGRLPAGRPGLLPAKQDWREWVRIAGLITGGRFDFSSVRNRAAAKIAAELLFKAGRFGAVIDIVEGKLTKRDGLAILRDFMMRLDRKCAAYATFPGQGVMLAGEPAYIFPARADAGTASAQ